MNLGLLVSPSLGGAIYDMAGYDAVFALTLGLIVLVFVLRVAVVEKATATRFLTGGVPIPSDSGSKPTAVEPGTPPNRKNSGAKTVSQEGRAGSDETSPLLPGFSPKKSRNWLAAALPAIDVLLSSRRLRAAVYGGLIHTTIITAFDTVLPLFLKRTFGWTATAGGLLFLAISLPSLLGTPVGALSDRYGTRSLSVLGFATVAPSLALLGLIRWNTILDKIMLGVLLFVIGKSGAERARVRNVEGSQPDHSPVPRYRPQLYIGSPGGRRLPGGPGACRSEPSQVQSGGRLCADIFALQRVPGIGSHGWARSVWSPLRQNELAGHGWWTCGHLRRCRRARLPLFRIRPKGVRSREAGQPSLAGAVQGGNDPCSREEDELRGGAWLLPPWRKIV